MTETTRLLRDLVTLPSVNPMGRDLPNEITLEACGRIVIGQPRGAANIVMACTVDEEYTFLGIQHLVKSGIKADMAVVAEPTMLNIVHAHKGVARWLLTAPGRSCHSSSPEQ